ncbi:MAG: hypothetical protein LBO20_07045 [Bifidobacteriaceae bacterium]|jgi:hypothetical protein|nr:hypothetical protein [Bifidobacteriaceae bacterium]
MLNWIEAKHWRWIGFTVLSSVLAVLGGALLLDGLKAGANAKEAALAAAAVQTGLTEQADLPNQVLPPLETTDVHIERAAAFAAQAFTWSEDNYADVRREMLAWADSDKAEANIEAMLPDATPQVRSGGAVAAAWRTGPDEVTLRLRQTVVRQVEAGNAHGDADHLLTIRLNTVGKVISLTVVYARGEVS